jgi:peptide/nickel transport system permease protein
MISFLLRRLLQTIVVVFIVTIVVFVAMRMLPGDPILLLITSNQAASSTPEHIAELRHQYGLDKPIPVQYIDWINRIVHGDLGASIISGNSITLEIARRVPITFHLSILAFIFSAIVGIFLGAISAIRRGSWIDSWATLTANIGITIPEFWLAVLLVYLFSLRLGWLPVYGYTSPFSNFALNTRQIILPVICLSIFGIASTARQTRSAMLEVLRQDYIRTAWAKGHLERNIIFKHVLKNALIPVITLMGLGLSRIMGGAVLIETVFNIPGMGRLAVTAVQNQDYPVVQAIILISAITVMLANFAVDVCYGWLDPRIRYQ